MTKKDKAYQKYRAEQDAEFIEHRRRFEKQEKSVSAISTTLFLIIMAFLAFGHFLIGLGIIVFLLMTLDAVWPARKLMQPYPQTISFKYWQELQNPTTSD